MDTVQTGDLTSRVGALRDDLRDAVGRVDDPQAKALFETAAEVLGGLQHAFVDRAEGTEEAWRR